MHHTASQSSHLRQIKSPYRQSWTQIQVKSQDFTSQLLSLLFTIISLHSMTYCCSCVKGVHTNRYFCAREAKLQHAFTDGANGSRTITFVLIFPKTLVGREGRNPEGEKKRVWLWLLTARRKTPCLRCEICRSESVWWALPGREVRQTKIEKDGVHTRWAKGSTGNTRRWCRFGQGVHGVCVCVGLCCLSVRRSCQYVFNGKIKKIKTL